MKTTPELSLPPDALGASCRSRLQTRFWAGMLAAAWCAATLASAQTAAGFAPGTTIKATLTTEIESANAQVGDQVSAASSAEVKQGKVNLPKGTTFNGKVTQVSAAKDSQSPAAVAVLFYQAITPKGQTYSLLAGVASVEKPKAASSGPSFGRGGGGRGGGGYGRRSGGGGGGAAPPPSSTGSASTAVPDIRFPADAAATGSVLTSHAADVWVYPATKITLQIIAAPTPGPSAGH